MQSSAATTAAGPPNCVIVYSEGVSASLRVVYFGTPQFAVPTLRALLGSRHQVVALVSQPDRPKGRGHHLAATPTKEAAVAHGVPVLQPTRIREDAFLDEVRALAPDLGVVAAYGRILPDALLAIPRLGMINVHASLLPKYRGAAPVHRAVIAGERETGVTIMQVVRELDAGPMLASVRHAIADDDTSVDVERALATLGARLLVEVTDALADGRASEVEQDHARATLAPKITKEESAVPWTLGAAEIHNRVRGLQPWPLVAIRVDGARYLLHRTSLPHERTAAAPGTIVAAAGDRLEIAAGDGLAVRVASIQPEGRRAMTPRELLSGRRLPVGAVVTPA
jgi:methionyl-tRNA formyltransferase